LLPDDLAELSPGLEEVELPLRHVLHAPGEPLTHVYFPEVGYASMLAYMEGGGAAEVGMVGREGMIGLPIMVGAEHDDIEALVQAPGTALRMGVQMFREKIEHHPALRVLLLRYSLAYHRQMARTAACNGRHNIEQRLARWLLMAHDRAEKDEFPMTYKFLGMMLGVHRTGVAISAGKLQKAGFIRYGRRCIEVIDRPGLESASCKCYSVAQHAYDQLLGDLPKVAPADTR
jgi:CRP-like cAMP-binding protein